MKLGRCPICHSQIQLEALVQDEAGRQLMAALVPLTPEHGTAVVSYIGLFRAHNRDLANDRALRLIREVLELGGAEIAPALVEVVEAMRSKAQQNPAVWKPLSNHNYLKRVIEGLSVSVAPVAATAMQCVQPAKMTSKTAGGMMALEVLKGGN